MDDPEIDKIRFLTPSSYETHFIYRPPQYSGDAVQDAQLYVKFANATRILDPWHIFGGTRWSRTIFRLKHPIVYSKRGVKQLWRKIKRIFAKEKMYIPERKGK